MGVWGWGIGDWAQSPIPNPQSPIPIPKKLAQICHVLKLNLFRKKLIIKKFKKKNIINVLQRLRSF